MRRSAHRGMLLLWDRGCHDFAIVDAAWQRGERILVRVITDSSNAGAAGLGRGASSNPRLAPAHAVAGAYHKRWEIELIIAELIILHL